MSAETVSTAVGEDGVRIAAEALKHLAAGKDIDGLKVDASLQLQAATTLMSYGMAYVDDYGNSGTG